MADSLSNARALAESLRYRGDRPGIIKAASAPHQLGSFFKHNELQISEAITPSLFQVLAFAAERLRMAPDQVDAYVYESPSVQATCVVHDGDRCLIRVSSGLVTLLSEAELAFVLGHEIGHHLLGHAHAAPPDRSPEEQLVARAAEVSADRVGLVACGSIDVAARALMKSLSGLPDRLIRFDVGRYLAQFSDACIASGHEQLTHPSMGVRCRALLWFSAIPGAPDGAIGEGEKAVLDDRVAKDLRRYIDLATSEQIERAEQTLTLWVAVDAIVRDGRMSRAEQAWLVANFGADVAGSVTDLVGLGSKDDAQRTAAARREAALAHLRTIAPMTWMEREAKAIQIAGTKPE